MRHIFISKCYVDTHDHVSVYLYMLSFVFRVPYPIGAHMHGFRYIHAYLTAYSNSTQFVVGQHKEHALNYFSYVACAAI